mgnify:CR=1 FL=1
MRSRDTKGRIVEAAFGLFAEQGYHAVSVRDIAAAVGVKDASLYNHFPGKQAIFDAVLAAQLERTRAVFAEQGVMTAPVEDPAGYAGAFEETERRVLAGFRHFFADGDMVRLRRLLAASRYASRPARPARSISASRRTWLRRASGLPSRRFPSRRTRIRTCTSSLPLTPCPQAAPTARSLIPWR